MKRSKVAPYRIMYLEKMEARKEKLSDINKFINNTDTFIDKLLADLKWTREELLNNRTTQNVQNSSNKHVESLPDSYYNEGHPYSVKLDNYSQAKIVQNSHGVDSMIENAIPSVELASRDVPSSHEDLVVNFTKDERKAMYQHVIDTTPRCEQLPELKISFQKKNAQTKMTSLADVAAYRRDIRRRNQKYRVAKNPLTYQEEVRNLIQLQTEAFAEYLGQGNVDNRNQSNTLGDDDRKTKRLEAKSSRSHSRSSSREGNRKRCSDDREERSREKKRKSEKKKRKRSRSRSRSKSRPKSKKHRDRSRDRSSERRHKKKHKSRH